MPTFPAKINYASGDILTAVQMIDVGNGLNDLLPDAKGSLTTVSAANTPAQLTVGNSGETLVANSAATTGLSWSGANQVNPVINSAFDIWQRGTSFVGTSGGYTADRWRIPSVAARTYSRQTASLDGFEYCMRLQRDSGNSVTNITGISQTLETSNALLYRDKTLTLSFWARKGADYSAASDVLQVRLFTGTTVNQAKVPATPLTGEATLITQSATLTTSWQKFTYTASSAVANTANVIAISLQFAPVGTASTDDYFEVTGVQLDIGSVALPYRRTGGTIQGELAACQRYYYRQSGTTDGGQFNVTASAVSTADVIGIFQVPVTMRVKPAAVDFSLVGVTDWVTAHSVTTVTVSGFGSNDKAVRLTLVVGSGLTQYRPYFGVQFGAGTGHIGVSAEL